MEQRTPQIRVTPGPDGAMLYLVASAPPTLPPVRTGDLADAWVAAREAAGAARRGPRVVIRFASADASLDLALADGDARCWTAAIDHQWRLDTTYGLSLCLRLLGLVDLLTSAAWRDRFCQFTRRGARLHPALLRAVAATALSPEAGLHRAEVEARLDLGLAARFSPLARPDVPTGVSHP